MVGMVGVEGVLGTDTLGTLTFGTEIFPTFGKNGIEL